LSFTCTDEEEQEQVTDKGKQGKMENVEIPDPLRASKAELTVAENAIKRMREAATHDAFAEAWRQFLDSIEKLWNKAERACQPVHQRFAPWQGKYTALRRSDELLRYVKQARDADNHSIQEILAPVHAGVVVKGPVTISSGKIHGSGEVEGLRTDRPIKIEKYEKLMPVKVKNSGHWCDVPTQHLGKPLRDPNPLSVAELTLAFYRDFIFQIEAKFFT
jgi:hypothetical protein